MAALDTQKMAYLELHDLLQTFTIDDLQSALDSIKAEKSRDDDDDELTRVTLTRLEERLNRTTDGDER